MYECDFDINECDWTNVWYEDTTDWLVGSDPTNKRIIGHGGNGTYLYLGSEYSDQMVCENSPFSIKATF